MRAVKSACAAAALAVACAAGCGTGPAMPGGPSSPTAPYGVTVTLDPAARHQVMQGFGGAVAFYTNFLSNHPARDRIYQALFGDLGIQMLRIANWSGNTGGPGAMNDTVNVVKAATAVLGHPPLLQMSAWSPPATLKSNASTKNGGTLARLTDGSGGYRYADYAQWWVTSLAAHAQAGVVPDFISIQNEPDYTATWETCLLAPAEDTNRAAYGSALAAVADALDAAAAAGAPRPKIIGPETAGIGGSSFDNHLTALMASGAVARLDGIAHHLYSGGNAALPSSFNAALNDVAGWSQSTGKPLFMTEYGPSDPEMFATAWLINNAVTVEGVSAYLYWPLTWPQTGAVPTALVTTENPTAPATWKLPDGWAITDLYYAVRHFSKWIEPGWQRVDATAGSALIQTSAFVSPDGTRATLVLLNTDTFEHGVTVDPGTFTAATTAVYRTSGTGERTADVGPLAGAITMPGRSIVTVTLGP